MKGGNMTTSGNSALAVLDNFGGAVPACPSDLDRPQIWRLTESGEWVEYPNEEGDIYTALFQFSTRHEYGKGKPVGVAFVVRTIGWGASLDPDGQVGDTPPSERPDRFRVALDICATPSGSIGSRLSFHSGEKAGEVIDDTGEATGQLAQTVDLAAFRVWGRDFTSALLMDYTTKADDMTEAQTQHLAHRVARFLDVLNDESEGE
jgi:hypothetical protein